MRLVIPSTWIKKILTLLFSSFEADGEALFRKEAGKHRSYLEPREPLSLRGANLTALDAVFGSELTHSVLSSQGRRNEAKGQNLDASATTNCVGLIAPYGIEMGGWIDLDIILEQSCKYCFYLSGAGECAEPNGELIPVRVS